MSHHKADRLHIGFGDPCPHCRNQMRRFKHSAEWRPDPKQAYWFAYWDVCGRCHYVQHYEIAKRYREEIVSRKAVEAQLGERFSDREIWTDSDIIPM
jgi:hypothetical protein